MHVTLAGFVLFLHIGVVIAAFAVAGVLHAALHTMSRARSVAELRPSAALVHRLEPLLPILALFILGFGAWLVHLDGDEGIGWGDGWVAAGLAALIVIEGLAGALLAPRTKQLVASIETAPDGLIDAELRAKVLDSRIWDIAHIATLGFFGVVFVMAAKPAGWLAAIIIVGCAAIGVALSRWQLSVAAALALPGATQPVAAAGAPAPRSASTSETAGDLTH